MAASTENTTDAAGLKKVWNETVLNVQTRFKEVEKAWNDAFTQLNTRVKGAETEARDFVKKFEEDGKKRLDTIRSQVKFDDLVAKLKTDKLFEQGAKLTSETIERLGLAKREDVEDLAESVKKLSTKVETIRRKANGAVASKDLKALEKRVAALEKGAGTTTAKKAPAKRTTTRKTTSSARSKTSNTSTSK